MYETESEMMKLLRDEAERANQPTVAQRHACYRLGIDRRLVKKMTKQDCSRLLATSIEITKKFHKEPA